LLVAISDWVDNANSELSPGEADWSRIGKVAEEVGEVVAAYYGATGQNPRKGVTGTMSDVVEELLDVAVVALGAIEHFTGHSGSALDMLDDKVVRIAQRAGLL
jgi:NTP pyrophosphatase (non-canonical NTP hydrolase)